MLDAAVSACIERSTDSSTASTDADADVGAEVAHEVARDVADEVEGVVLAADAERGADAVQVAGERVVVDGVEQRLAVREDRLGVLLREGDAAREEDVEQLLCARDVEAAADGQARADGARGLGSAGALLLSFGGEHH